MENRKCAAGAQSNERRISREMLQSYREDGGRPTEIGCQEQVSNHSKRLSLRVMVVSIGVKREF